MKKMLLMLAAGLLLLSCGTDGGKQSPFSLQGAWMLTRRVYPEGYTSVVSPHERTLLRWYEGDSMLYEFQLTKTEHALMVTPVGKGGVTLTYKGGGEYIYLENDNPCPLSVVSDTAVTIQYMGIVDTWQRADSIAQEWSTEIQTIIDSDLQGEITSDTVHWYVLSTTERQQNSLIHGLVYAIVAAAMLVLVVAQIALANRKEKRRLRLCCSRFKRSTTSVRSKSAKPSCLWSRHFSFPTNAGRCGSEFPRGLC